MGNVSALEEAAKRYLFGTYLPTTIDNAVREDEVEYFLKNYSKEFSTGVLILNDRIPAFVSSSAEVKAKMLAYVADRLKEQSTSKKI